MTDHGPRRVPTGRHRGETVMAIYPRILFLVWVGFVLIGLAMIAAQ
jgi:hypothetical protein